MSLFFYSILRVNYILFENTKQCVFHSSQFMMHCCFLAVESARCQDSEEGQLPAKIMKLFLNLDYQLRLFSFLFLLEAVVFCCCCYFWLHWVFVAVRGLSLVAVSGGYSSLWCTGFSLRWLLLQRSTGSRHVGFSSCGTRALERRLSSCGTQA